MIKRRFKFCPADIIRGHAGPYRGEAIGVWQWFVKQLEASAPSHKRPPFEWINGTSSINNSAPYPTGGEDFWVEPIRRTRQLLMHAGQNDPVGRFLRRHCQIPSWAALNRSIIATVQTSDEFPNSEWFQMQGRKFKKSPNSCHAQATSVFGAMLELTGDGWTVSVEYGYPHDSSHWFWRVRQAPGERLDDFSARVDAEIEAVMEPDLNPSRSYSERAWWESYRALKGVFYDKNFTMPDWENKLADAINKIDGSSNDAHRIRLTKSRLATLKRWALEFCS